MIAWVLIITVGLLLLPQDALAWGPVTHIVHGSAILANLTSLPPTLQALLEGHPERYLYGCIGADIIQAKAYTRSIATHCHSWPVAWKLISAARTDGQRAFAWGYMTHLGADIVSHNHFVPAHLLRSFDGRGTGHAYWEARADAFQQHRYWRRVRAVLEEDYVDCDRLVERVVQHTLFSFRTNKRIFDSLMALSKLERWQAFIAGLNRRSRYTLRRPMVQRYNAAAIASASDLLINGKKSFTQQQDPTGREILRRTMLLRRRLRALKRRDRLAPSEARRMIDEVLPELVAPPAAA